MAATHVAIANMALNKIGGKRITALTDANAVNDCYYDILDEVLMAYPWSFAQTRKTLVATTAPTIFTEDGLTTCFTKPSDMLKLNFTNSATAITKIEDSGILCNEESLTVLYTYRQTLATAYPAPFITALTTRLAAEVCFSYTNDEKKTAALYKEYEELRLPQAMAADSQQGSTDVITQDEWENARESGGGWLKTQHGADTWIPVT